MPNIDAVDEYVKSKLKECTEDEKYGNFKCFELLFINKNKSPFIHIDYHIIILLLRLYFE